MANVWDISSIVMLINGLNSVYIYFQIPRNWASMFEIFFLFRG